MARCSTVFARARDLARSPRAILVAGWAVFAIYAFPGFMSWDSVTHLWQARSGVYTDDHPPLVAATWRVLEVCLHGPLLVLVAQSVALLFAVERILATRLTPRGAAIGSVLVLWFPPIGSVVAVVFKDMWMAAGMLVAVALLVGRRPRDRAWAVVALVFATGVRYNALAATLPIVVLLVRVSDRLAGWRRYAIATAVWVGITGVAFAIDGALTDEHAHYWPRTQALQDIAGTLEYAPDLGDEQVRELLAGMPLVVHDDIQGRFRAIYQPVDFRHLFRGDGRVMDEPSTDAERAAVTRAWRALVLGYPQAYLRYRVDTFVMLTRLDGASYLNAYVGTGPRNHDHFDAIGYDASPGRLQSLMRDAMLAISQTHLFDPWPYLALSLVLLPFARRDRIALALLVSGLMYEAAWFVLAPTADYRYSQWLVTTTVLGGTLVVAERYRARRQTSVK